MTVAGAPPTPAEYYEALGFPEDAWHIGPEHPGLENLAIAVLDSLPGARVLEIGVQSGGFTIPVAMAAHTREPFSYTGVDNLEFSNAVPLRHVEAYLRRAGVTGALQFVEGDSTGVLRHAARDAYDLILLDHYKPKYPIDLYVIFRRQLLAPGGAVLLHDVLTHAADDWEVCKRVCRAFGYSWTLHPDVFQGAAVLRRTDGVGSSIGAGAEVYARWYAHASVLKSRRAIGRLLRTLGLRR